MSMNIAGMSTIANYLKTVELNMKWQERKQNPFKDKGVDPQIAEIKRWSEEQRDAQKISSIHGKMMSGAELTEDELEYLREANPELYQKALQIKREREEYKRELRNCKSKEEVERLNQRKLQQFVTEARAIASNPNIPREKKVELLEFLTMRMNAIMGEHTKFIESREYHQLPDKTDKSKNSDASVKKAADKDGDDQTEPKKGADDPVDLVNNLLAGVSVSAPDEHGSGETAPKTESKSSPETFQTKAAIHAYTRSGASVSELSGGDKKTKKTVSTHA